MISQQGQARVHASLLQHKLSEKLEQDWRGETTLNLTQRWYESFCEIVHRKHPPTPHRVLQGCGVVEGAYTFRFLNLKARASYSTNWMGGIALFGLPRSNVKVYYSTALKGKLHRKKGPEDSS